MAQRDIASTDYTDMTNTVTDFSVSPETTDGAAGAGEFTWINANWPQQFGYYKKIPELRASINARARWVIGKGVKTNEITQMLLMTIRGHGKDTFNSILENQMRVKDIGGDSFAEIITDDEGSLINLKPLSPDSIRVTANEQGIIIRYEQVNKKGKIIHKFKPEEIFHLSRDRTADEIHGISLIDSVEEIILMRNEAMADMRVLMHRYVKPRFIFHLDTDDTEEIADHKAKIDKAVEYAENLLIPKDVVVPELMSVPANATLNPLPWIDNLNNYFFQATGVPQIIVGGSQEFTEATAKIGFIAFEANEAEESLYLKEQVLAQLNLDIDLEFPASIQNELISDKQKDQQTAVAQPSELPPQQPEQEVQ